MKVTFRFLWWAVPSYLLTLVAAIALTLLVLGEHPQRAGWDGALLGAGITSLLLSVLLLSLIVAWLLFPIYWWMGQVQGQDVFQYEGVYFLGVRLSRVPNRLQRLLFGVDERFRRWDIVFGLIFLALLLPHGMLLFTAARVADARLPRPIRLPETVHYAALSSLPVMREWGVRWNPGAQLAQRVDRELNQLQPKSGKNNADWYRLAQLQLLRAFRPRYSLRAPYDYAPGDAVFFDRGVGAQSVDYLNQILSQPEAKRQELTAPALALMGFFHLCDYNPARAQPLLQQSLAAPDSPVAPPREIVLLLAAQSALMDAQPARARALLENLLAKAQLSAGVQALALEHLAESFRAQGVLNSVEDILGKAQALYAAQHDDAGLVRVHLRRAALLVDQGRLGAASEEVSRAAAQAQGLDDLFTLNMVERITHLVPALG